VLARLTAWAEASGAAVHVGRPGAGRLGAAVGAFAAGHPAVLLVGSAPPPDALLDVAVAELAAPMTAVLGADADGGLAVLGLTEVVPALLAPAGLGLAEALDLAFAAGLSPVVLPAL
jgi:glycosyltransferase A (GT-A) superfamily protein (DUF2064 family)